MGVKFNSQTNKWEVSYSKRHPITRKPVSLKRVGLNSQAEAKRTERRLILEIEDKIKAKIVPRWREAVDAWANDAVERGLTLKTVENYLYSIKAYTYAGWADRFVDSITTDDIRRLIMIELQGKKEGPRQSLHKHIRAVFEFAHYAGHISKNPTPVLRFKAGEKIKRVLTTEQAERLLTQAKNFDSEWYPIWCFAIYTGCRSGELHALTWDKVDLERNQILVSSSWSSRGGTKSTKSGDDRIVPIAPPLLPIIQELKLRHAAVSEFVLPRLSKWDKGEQARELRYFLGGLGMPQVKFHDLRATFATLLLQRGVEPIVVMKLGGWKTLKTMMIYARKAGVDVDGALDGFVLHNPSIENAKVIGLFNEQKNAF